ncbi:unnamed protein product [Choristocarpus tenellus]
MDQMAHPHLSSAHTQDRPESNKVARSPSSSMAPTNPGSEHATLSTTLLPTPTAATGTTVILGGLCSRSHSYPFVGAKFKRPRQASVNHSLPVSGSHHCSKGSSSGAGEGACAGTFGASADNASQNKPGSAPKGGDSCKSRDGVGSRGTQVAERGNGVTWKDFKCDEISRCGGHNILGSQEWGAGQDVSSKGGKSGKCFPGNNKLCADSLDKCSQGPGSGTDRRGGSQITETGDFSRGLHAVVYTQAKELQVVSGCFPTSLPRPDNSASASAPPKRSKLTSQVQGTTNHRIIATSNTPTSKLAPGLESSTNTDTSIGAGTEIGIVLVGRTNEGKGEARREERRVGLSGGVTIGTQNHFCGVRGCDRHGGDSKGAVECREEGRKGRAAGREERRRKTSMTHEVFPREGKEEKSMNSSHGTHRCVDFERVSNSVKTTQGDSRFGSNTSGSGTLMDNAKTMMKEIASQRESKVSTSASITWDLSPTPSHPSTSTVARDISGVGHTMCSLRHGGMSGKTSDGHVSGTRPRSSIKNSKGSNNPDRNIREGGYDREQWDHLEFVEKSRSIKRQTLSKADGDGKGSGEPTTPNNIDSGPIGFPAPLECNMTTAACHCGTVTSHLGVGQGTQRVAPRTVQDEKKMEGSGGRGEDRKSSFEGRNMCKENKGRQESSMGTNGANVKKRKERGASTHPVKEATSVVPVSAPCPVLAPYSASACPPHFSSPGISFSAISIPTLAIPAVVSIVATTNRTPNFPADSGATPIPSACGVNDGTIPGTWPRAKHSSTDRGKVKDNVRETGKQSRLRLTEKNTNKATVYGLLTTRGSSLRAEAGTDLAPLMYPVVAHASHTSPSSSPSINPVGIAVCESKDRTFYSQATADEEVEGAGEGGVGVTIRGDRGPGGDKGTSDKRKIKWEQAMNEEEAGEELVAVKTADAAKDGEQLNVGTLKIVQFVADETSKAHKGPQVETDELAEGGMRASEEYSGQGPELRCSNEAEAGTRTKLTAMDCPDTETVGGVTHRMPVGQGLGDAHASLDREVNLKHGSLGAMQVIPTVAMSEDSGISSEDEYCSTLEDTSQPCTFEALRPEDDCRAADLVNTATATATETSLPPRTAPEMVSVKATDSSTPHEKDGKRWVMREEIGNTGGSSAGPRTPSTSGLVANRAKVAAVEDAKISLVRLSEPAYTPPSPALSLQTRASSPTLLSGSTQTSIASPRLLGQGSFINHGHHSASDHHSAGQTRHVDSLGDDSVRDSNSASHINSVNEGKLSEVEPDPEAPLGVNSPSLPLPARLFCPENPPAKYEKRASVDDTRTYGQPPIPDKGSSHRWTGFSVPSASTRYSTQSRQLHQEQQHYYQTSSLCVAGQVHRTVVLKPCLSPPLPKESSEALKRLGVAQVVHVEPFYSRPDDVPSQTRELGGTVFRIRHRDDLEELDTFPSRCILHKAQVIAADAHWRSQGSSVPSSGLVPSHGMQYPRPAQAAGQYFPPSTLGYKSTPGEAPILSREAPLLCPVSSPAVISELIALSKDKHPGQSDQDSVMEYNVDNSGHGWEKGCSGIDSGASLSFQQEQRSGRSILESGGGEDGGGVEEIDKAERGGDWGFSGSASILGSGSQHHGRRCEAPTHVYQGMRHWKKEAAQWMEWRTAGQLQRRKEPRVVVLEPTFSPPLPHVVTSEWTVSREKKLGDVDGPHNMPARLKTKRNVLGVLGCRGGGDLGSQEEDSGQTIMVQDANTGKLMPTLEVQQPLSHGLSSGAGKQGGINDSVPDSSLFLTPLSQPSSEGVALETPFSEAVGLAQDNASPILDKAHHSPSGGGDGEHCSALGTRVVRSDASSHKRWLRPRTQAPHRAPTRSQISPTTQTPSSSLSEDPSAHAPFRIAGTRGSGGRTGVGDRLTVLAMELHVQVGGGDRQPDPRLDPVHAVCWSVRDSYTTSERETVHEISGIVVLPPPQRQWKRPTVATTAQGGTGAGIAGLDRGMGANKIGVGGGRGGNGETDEESSSKCLKCGAKLKDSGEYCVFKGGGFLIGGGQGATGSEGGGGDEERGIGGQKDNAKRSGGLGPGRQSFQHGLGKGVEVMEVCSEAEVMLGLVAVFRRFDPDFVVGWEVQGDSLGYLIERGTHLVRLL